MSTVNSILQAKGGTTWSVTPKTTVYEALEVMASHNIGAVLVMDGGKVVGIFTERDYARKIALAGKNSRTTPVSELMSTKIYYVKPEATSEECMSVMTDHHFRHLPVLDGDKIIGLISIGDVVKSVLAEQQFRIQQLENYITGPTYPGAKD